MNVSSLSPREFARRIDHTLLKPDATREEIRQLCQEAVTYGFKTVCVNPCHVPLAKRELLGAEADICAVIGFPLGADMTEMKALAAVAAVKAGAREIDVVMNIGCVKSGMMSEAKADLNKMILWVKTMDPDIVVKVILENCLLTDQEKELACLAAVEAGCDFVKTSTGFGASGAKATDIQLMRRTVGPEIGIKAAGGIRSLADAMAMLEAGADRLGASAGVAIMEEISRT